MKINDRKKKLLKKMLNSQSTHSNSQASKSVISHETSMSKSKNSASPLQEKMRKKLLGARFRQINEKLYTQPSNLSFTQFSKDPALFDVYHEGFRSQCSSWPTNPLDLIIKELKFILDKTSSKGSPCKNVTIADLGCGEAKLAQTLVPKYTEFLKVHSFDMVAPGELSTWITPCNIAHKIPLESNSVDIVVICLALMSTDFQHILGETRRIMNKDGVVKIAEIESRFEDLEKFKIWLEETGWKIENFKKMKMFVRMDLMVKQCCEQESSGKTGNYPPPPRLKPCIYKKR